ncbi:RelA/SpoT family protein [Salinibius halmophilus]|uniref:RelA/SpoT family protein n=1 Tax=Salinibius halmophilus TaxID=1853216 RepID=UPI000E66886D|nr:RelA/SpoT family protein [Salinibius halmophilus]
MPVANIDELAFKLSSYLSPKKVNRVRRAYYYAEQAHEGQYRRSGEPYIIHPLQVAEILSDMHMDHQSLMAAMLHDVLEDTPVNKDALIEQFGANVAEMVDGVSKLTHLKFENKQEEQAENFQKIVLAMAKDIRVILVKLADRLHNMRTLGVMPPHKKRRIAKETLDIYAPVAQRLGIGTLRRELEDLCFENMHPMRSTRIKAAVRSISGNRNAMVEKIQQALQDQLDNDDINAVVFGREKHLYSIYKKMQEQRKAFESIMDVYGFRIVTDSVDNCYRILGIVHNYYKPIPNRFKDYIAIPKANGYQSLHTTLIGMNGVPIEIQIRTKEMDEMAAWGIASHSLYKQNDSHDPHPAHARARRWVKGLLEIQQRAGNPVEFIENVKIDLFPDEIYVFSPKGKIIELPKQACAIDFAYAIHTDVGNRCTGCLINRKVAPLTQPLKSGDTVRILTGKLARPNPAWLNHAITAKARASIRHHMKTLRESDSQSLGYRMLSSAVQALGGSIEALGDDAFDRLISDANIESKAKLFEDIGLGNRLPYLVAHRLLNVGDDSPANDASKPMKLSGAEGVLVSYAKCCHPIPGDPIVGVISKGKGLMVHVESCKNINDLRNDPDRCLPFAWDEQIDHEFVVDLRLEVQNERGALAKIAAAVAEAEANIETINMDERDANTSVVRASISVYDRVHLARVIRLLRRLDQVVLKISRIYA